MGATATVQAVGGTLGAVGHAWGAIEYSIVAGRAAQGARASASVAGASFAAFGAVLAFVDLGVTAASEAPHKSQILEGAASLEQQKKRVDSTIEDLNDVLLQAESAVARLPRGRASKVTS